MARAKKRTTTKHNKQTAPVRAKVQTASDSQTSGNYQSRRDQNVQAGPKFQQRLTSAPKLFVRSLNVLWTHRNLFAVMWLVYVGLYALLVSGVSGSGAFNSVKAALKHGSGASASSSLFSTLMNSGSSANPNAGVYQSLLLLIMSVVVIWALRQIYAGHPIRARDAFYQGVYPLIPFTLVLLVIGLELVPLGVGAALYSMFVGGGILLGFEVPIAFAVVIALAGLTLYWVCSSLFALYIVTLPDMTPMLALHDARKLVRGRRWIIIRKVLFLPIALLLIGAIILLPFALYLTPAAAILLLLLSTLALAVAHSYLYALYRELL